MELSTAFDQYRKLTNRNKCQFNWQDVDAIRKAAKTRATENMTQSSYLNTQAFIHYCIAYGIQYGAALGYNCAKREDRAMKKQETADHE